MHPENVYAGIPKCNRALREITVDMGADSLVLTKYDTANIDYSQAITVMFGLEGKAQVEVFQL